MESILNSLGNSIGVWGYFILFFYSLGGGFVALSAGGILSSGVIGNASGLNIILIIIVCFIANFIGSVGLFFIAKYQKNELMKAFTSHKRKIALSALWIRKYGVLAIFLHKYIYGVKTIIPIAMGFSRYSVKKFIILNFFASMLWSVSIGSVSYIMGESFKKLLDESENLYLFSIIGVCLIALLLFIITKISKRSFKTFN